MDLFFQDFEIYQILNLSIDFNVIENEDIRNLCKDLMEKNPNKRIDSKNALIKARKIKKKILG